MAAAVSKGGSPQVTRPGSRTDSPLDPSNTIFKSEDSPSIKADNKDTKATVTTSVDSSQNVPAPRRPGQASESEDYFTSLHNANHLSLEPNPFEQSFGNPATDTPSKSLLPPVAAITSPALPGTSSSGGFNWANSLRAGPLSPAMLAGPAGSNEYLDNIGRGGFPTPNESGLRTGLTPGGGGSMFPAPSPGQLLQQIPSGGATPSTLDFHRTAINAARKNGAHAPTSNPQEPDQMLPQSAPMEMSKSQQVYSFPHPDATDAANGLFMLAKGAQASNNPFGGPTSQPVPQQNRNGHIAQDPSLTNNDPNSISAGDGVHMNGDLSDEHETKPNARGKGKKNAAKSTTTANGRRKAEDSSKPANKKLKGSNGAAIEEATPSDDEFIQAPQPEAGSSGGATNKKMMTDEEKKKNFKERNRVAALKCRQRRKQWVSSLQAKVEAYSNENEMLNNSINKLREELMLYKSVLMAHKDCPLAQSHGVTTALMNGMGNEFMPNNNGWNIRR